MLLVALGSAAVLSIYQVSGRSGLVLICLALLLLLPSRIQGHYWRPFFRGRRLLGAGDPAGAISEFEQFLSDLERRPWLAGLIRLNASIYTNSARAMALNNIGAACLSLSRWPEAEAAFGGALTADPEAPLPHYNLALLHHVLGREEQATVHLDQARTLGYHAATIDRLVHQAGGLLARIEGRGASAPSAA